VTDIYPTRWPPFVTFADPVIQNAFTEAAWLALALAVIGIGIVTIRFAIRFFEREGTMGRLKMPFVAAAAALIIIAVLSSERLFPRWPHEDQLISGLIVGVLGTVVLYAVMRAIAKRK
jgi:hypothetical protein